MFWKKKRVNEISIDALYTQLIIFSYDIHDKALEVDKETRYLEGKGEELYYHIVAASAMTALAKLDDKYYGDYYQELMTRLNEKYTKVPVLAEHFNDVIRDKYEIKENGEENLEDLIAYWLYFNVGSDNEEDFPKEFIPYALAAKMIYGVYDRWFEKNNMPIK